MTAGVFAIVMAAALLHALWNALVKAAGDRTVMLGLIALGHCLPGFALVLVLPWPDPASWVFIVASTVIHWGYYYMLNLAYRLGDLSVVYPIARGSAPMLVALGAQIWVGERLSPGAWAGIAAISAGIALLARPSRHATMPLAGMLAAFATALTIVAYSLADGVGVRASGQALSYVAWLFAAEAIVAVWVLAPRSARLRALPRRTLLLGLAGGVISGMAYGLALYAKTLAPLGLVSALRETSVVLAALIGLIWLDERPVGPRLAAAAVVALGIGMIALT